MFHLIGAIIVGAIVGFIAGKLMKMEGGFFKKCYSWNCRRFYRWIGCTFLRLCS